MTNPRDIAPEEYPAVLAQYQQWLADEQLTRASIEVKWLNSVETARSLQESLDRAEEELRILRDSLQSSTFDQVGADST